MITENDAYLSSKEVRKWNIASFKLNYRHMGKKELLNFLWIPEGSQIWVIKKKGVTCPLNSSTHLFSHEVKNTV